MQLITHYDGDRISGFYVEIRSFSPDNVSVFVDDFQAICAIMDQATDQDMKLVINLMQNGGGYITLGFRSLAVLAPYVYPKYG